MVDPAQRGYEWWGEGKENILSFKVDWPNKKYFNFFLVKFPAKNYKYGRKFYSSVKEFFKKQSCFISAYNSVAIEGRK